MCNEEILFRERVQLAKDGKLGTTGREVIHPDGFKCEEPEQIHTYSVWKQLGYSVKKGEKAITKIPIWKRTVKKKEVDGKEEEIENMFMKTSSFFKFSQVEKTKA